MERIFTGSFEHQEPSAEDAPLQVEEMKEQVDLINETVKTFMKPDIHYGRIPGKNSKPTLLKPGAEKILTLLRIAAKPFVVDLSGDDDIRYRVIVRGYYPSGRFAGGGVGECSSNEENFKWRKALCDEEYTHFPEDRRRIKFYRDNRSFGTVNEVKQVRVDAAEQANTVLKIAKKRALIDMCLTVAAVSDLFTQDLEDYDYAAPAENDQGSGPDPQPAVSRPAAVVQFEPPVESHHAQGEIISITDEVKKIASKELKNGSLKWGILTARNNWLSTFKNEHAQIAELAQAERYRVSIDYVIKGSFKNIRSIELLEKVS